MFVSIREAKAQLSRLMEQVAAGEEIVITKAGKPVARLIAFSQPRPPKRKPGSMKGKTWISPDFDAADKEIQAMFEGDLA